MNRAGRFSEDSRQIVHMTMGGFALLLRYLTPGPAAILAGGAVAFNLFALPRLAGTLYRPGEVRRRLSSGIVLYPVGVLLLTHTGRIRMFRQDPLALFERYVEALMARVAPASRPRARRAVAREPRA